jgi:twinkle protein
MQEAETLSATHVAWLEKRGLEPELAARLGFHSESSAGGDVLAIPFFRQGARVNTKRRTTSGEKRFWQDKGAVKAAWNEDCLRDDTLLEQPLIICEGELDAASAIQAGFSRVISVPDGAPPTKTEASDATKYSWIDPIRSLLGMDRVRQIILAADNDAPGANLLHDLALRLGNTRCKYLTYPKDPEDPTRRMKDLNEVLAAFGERGVTETIKRAQWMRVTGIYRMSELPPVPDASSYDIGFEKLRDHYRVRLGDFAVFTGIPSHGKSSFVNDLCCRLVDNHGLNVAFASFEQLPQRDHRRNLRTWRLGRPAQYAEPKELAEVDAWIDKHFSFLVPDDDADVDIEWVLDRCEAAVIQYDAKVVVLDPWNEMDHARASGESLTEYTGRAIKTFKRFSKKTNTHLIVVAHPTKQQKDDAGNYRIPTLYDISDSAHWYNKADVGVVVHRESQDSTIIRVAKSRYHDEIGTPGEVRAQYQFEKRRYQIV